MRGALFAMHELAQEHFRANLNGSAGEAARNYLARRGVKPETIEQFGLGYSLPAGRALLRLFEERQFPAAQMVESGLIGQREGGRVLRPFSQPPDVSHPQPIGQNHRLWREGAWPRMSKPSI